VSTRKPRAQVALRTGSFSFQTIVNLSASGGEGGFLVDLSGVSCILAAQSQHTMGKEGSEMVTNQSPVLMQPESEEFVGRLHRLKDEYSRRIEAYHGDHPNQHPEIRERAVAKEICAVAILDELLSKGHVVAWDANLEFMKLRMAENETQARAFVMPWEDAWDEIEGICS